MPGLLPLGFYTSRADSMTPPKKYLLPGKAPAKKTGKGNGGKSAGAGAGPIPRTLSQAKEKAREAIRKKKGAGKEPETENRLARAISRRSERFAEDSPYRNREALRKPPGRAVGSRNQKPTLAEAEQARNRIIISLRRERHVFSKDARATLAACEVDPVRILALAAVGDAVGLGLMRAEDYDQAAVLDAETGEVIEPGGKELAADLLPASLRLSAAKDLLPYLYAKPQDVAPRSAEDDDRAQIYLPENGRTSTGREGEAGGEAEGVDRAAQ